MRQMADLSLTSEQAVLSVFAKMANMLEVRTFWPWLLALSGTIPEVRRRTFR